MSPDNTTAALLCTVRIEEGSFLELKIIKHYLLMSISHNRLDRLAMLSVTNELWPLTAQSLNAADDISSYLHLSMSMPAPVWDSVLPFCPWRITWNGIWVSCATDKRLKATTVTNVIKVLHIKYCRMKCVTRRQNMLPMHTVLFQESIN